MSFAPIPHQATVNLWVLTINYEHGTSTSLHQTEEDVIAEIISFYEDDIEFEDRSDLAACYEEVIEYVVEHESDTVEYTQTSVYIPELADALVQIAGLRKQLELREQHAN